MASKRARKLIARLKSQARNPEGLLNTTLKNNAAKMSTKMTWPEKEFKKLLKELKVEFQVQKIVGNKIYDFYIPHVNMLVEVDGDYWHGNKEKFSVLNGLQEKVIRNDKFKDGLAAGLGFTLERVWENDLKVNYKVVKAKFKKLLKA
jgi:very-short-patch-repair endonuclease